MILTITGPSASGKSTLTENIIAARPGTAKPLESITTRLLTDKDKLRGEYRSVPQSWFEALQEHDRFAWHTEIHGNLYGTRKQAVYDALESERLHIATLDFVGIAMLIQHAILVDKRSQVRSIYLYVEDESELRTRLIHRGRDSPENIEQRIVECRSWNAQARSMEIPFHFIDGMLPKEAVLAQALAFLDEPAKNSRPSIP